MEDWIQQVLSKWKREEVKLNPPVSIAEIEHTESTLDFKLPRDFKNFYLEANGFDGFDWQENMFTLYPLELIIKEFETSTNKNFIAFCDFLLASHFIGFNRNQNGVFKWYNDDDGERIADTFETVIDMINSDSKLIY